LFVFAIVGMAKPTNNILIKSMLVKNTPLLAKNTTAVAIATALLFNK
jgi:hypothetical protein